MTYQIKLPKELQRFVNDKVATGRSRSPEDAVVDAVREQHKREEKKGRLKRAIRSDLDAAWAELLAEKTVDGPSAMDSIRQKVAVSAKK